MKPGARSGLASGRRAVVSLKLHKMEARAMARGSFCSNKTSSFKVRWPGIDLQSPWPPAPSSRPVRPVGGGVDPKGRVAHRPPAGCSPGAACVRSREVTRSPCPRLPGWDAAWGAACACSFPPRQLRNDPRLPRPPCHRGTGRLRTSSPRARAPGPVSEPGLRVSARLSRRQRGLPRLCAAHPSTAPACAVKCCDLYSSRRPACSRRATLPPRCACAQGHAVPHEAAAEWTRPPGAFRFSSQTRSDAVGQFCREPGAGESGGSRGDATSKWACVLNT